MSVQPAVEAVTAAFCRTVNRQPEYWSAVRSSQNALHLHTPLFRAQLGIDRFVSSMIEE